MSTIRDVALRAGVSTMTVSRVVNRSNYISPETRTRVEAAIVELGYVPNSLARSLRSKKSKTLALVLTDITNPFFTTVARGVEDTASEQGFSVIFCNTDESPSEESEHLTLLVQKQVDGVLLVPARSSGEPVAFLREQHVPVVVVDRRVPDSSVDSVRCDSEEGAYQLLRLLIELGHRRGAVLSGPAAVSTAADRVAGCRRAWTEAGLDPEALLACHDDYTQAGGYRMAQEALNRVPVPTAIFAANNFIAIGAYRAIADAGLRVPEDVAMVTFDDMPIQLVSDPFFTVVAQPAYEMGCRATRILLDRLSGEAQAECKEVVLPFELIVRRSSGPPR
jgi:LacI family transcriptional regulator